MRVIPLTISALVTLALVIALNRKWGAIPPLGKFLSPQHGFWQNAEPSDKDFNQNIGLAGLKGKSNVYFDERLIPHIFAENDNDAYMIQGYVHAKFRLWQMEFQVFAAGGMVSSVTGAGDDGRYLKYDRSMRRLGMVYAAEKSLAMAEADPVSKQQMDAYTAGVNAWIDQLKESELPVEYKLLDYKPQHWTNLKSCIFAKYLSYDLAGGDDDLEFTNAKSVFSFADFEELYPTIQDSAKPIVPNSIENPYPTVPAFAIDKPATADSIYFHYKNITVTNIIPRPDRDNGSNNWAVSGTKTADGKPILCNDPHLGLNLPSIWFEMQISTPKFNCYGASFPGAPNVIIGYNDSIAFGFTNAGRDVKDYYEIKFRDESMNEYWFDSAWVKSTKRIEQIERRNEAALLDTVVYTLFGPVIYEPNFPASKDNNSYYSVRWKANDASNELMIFNKLNHAKNYDDYLAGIKYLTCPGQNPVFASKSGDIAIWQQGDFPAKWKRQGDFIMPGTDSSFMWKGIIPQGENPHMKNPSRGYVSSANQISADTSYPYYTGNDFPVYRGYIINRYLDSMTSITANDMQRIQTDNYNVKAEFAKDILAQLNEQSLTTDQKKYLSFYKSWNLRNDPIEKGATVFTLWWKELEDAVWGDDFEKAAVPLPWPNEATLVETLHKNNDYKFIDDVRTPGKEILADILLRSFQKACATLKQMEDKQRLTWTAFKDTKVQHLLKLPAFSKLHVPIGGGKEIINATKDTHGPSWRMVVHLSDVTEAYGVYPGGQSGNPGSRFYDNFIDTWARGAYYTLWMMKSTETKDQRVKWTMHFSAS